MANTIISTGDTYRIYDSAVKTYDQLPAATYRVQFSPMSGYSLSKVSDIALGNERVYGEHAAKLDRIIKTYGTLDRSLGVLMSGDKGMGKSLMIRMLAEKITTEKNLPVILVDVNEDGIADFLDTLGEAVIVFDEFEKRYPKARREDGSAQDKFLSLFDGLSNQKRLYIVTVNDLFNLSDYFVNRPGRFHYHIRFNYPEPEEVRTYLQDQAPNAFPSEIQKVVDFTAQVKINYDHLRAIAFEINRGDAFSDVIGDLNIKQIGDQKYLFTVEFEDGYIETAIDTIDMFDDSGNREYIHVEHPTAGMQRIDFRPSDFEPHKDILVAKKVKVSSAYAKDNSPTVKSFTAKLIKQSSYAF